ncbi:MAG: multicopper oxidase domain-containing protein [Gemmatimonadaceae bacterium]
MRAPLTLLIAFLLLSAGHPAVPPATEAALPNDNRTPAGRLTNGVLRLRLEAREARWYPETEKGVGVPVFAIAEAGKRARTPAPLIRVPRGTMIEATIRNRLPKAVAFGGLRARGEPGSDSVIVPPGEETTVRFPADVEGTYYYWGRTEAYPPIAGPGLERDATLVGAFIVDSINARRSKNERILVLGSFSSPVSELGIKSEAADVVLRRESIPREKWFITGVNGLSWPHTERLTYTVGDTVKFRVINAGRFPHPMHLHGFYFQVHSKGDAHRDTVYADSMRRDVVTEWIPGGTTVSLSWVPSRPGNWMFHCHLVTHISDVLRLSERARASGHVGHAQHGMAGLVTGIHVKPKGRTLVADVQPRRRMRVYVTERANVYGDRNGRSYVLQEQDGAPAADSIAFPSSTLVLRQNEPTEIAVINVSRSPTTVHWHGLELESVFDGVGGWSGWGKQLAPVIAPGDSFVARLTPPRAGTFIYHSHVDEPEQIAAGLFGALIVVPAHASADTTDRLFLIGMAGPEDEAPPSVNGLRSPPPVEVRAGVKYRFRFINISPMETRTAQLLRADTVQRWRALAKDAFDLPPAQAIEKPAVVPLHAGETFDFEVIRHQPESLTLRILGPQSIPARREFVARAKPGERMSPLVLNVPVIVR